MASLSRSQKAAFGSAIGNRAPTELIISKIFHHSFELVAEILTVLCGSPQRAESIVANSLTQMASPKLTDEPARNLARLRTRSLETLKAEWIATPTLDELRHSPLALIRSLPFEQATAYVLTSFGGLDTTTLSVALSATEAGAKNHLRRGTETVKSRLKDKPGRDVASVFNSEAEILANQVFADPEILVQILLDLATQRGRPAPAPRKTIRSRLWA